MDESSSFLGSTWTNGAGTGGGFVAYSAADNERCEQVNADKRLNTHTHGRMSLNGT